MPNKLAYQLMYQIGQNKFFKKGFSIVELLIYVTVFSIMMTVFTLFVLDLVMVQARTRINKDVFDNSSRALETMMFEIRHAQGLYASTTILGTHPGQLSLKTGRDAPADEQTNYFDFYLDDEGRLCQKKEGGVGEPLTAENIEITNLIFDYLISTSTESIRIQMTAIHKNDTPHQYNQATTTLISTATLRYE